MVDYPFRFTRERLGAAARGKLPFGAEGFEANALRPFVAGALARLFGAESAGEAVLVAA